MSAPVTTQATCAACGEPRVTGARFCEACGSAFEPKQGGGCVCASPEPDADGFCGICGLKAEGAVRFADFEEYVDDGLAMACDRGRSPSHPTNQDNGGVLRRADGLSLLVVADGVSTSDRPEAAALAALEGARTAFLDGRADETEETLARRCVLDAAQAVVALDVATTGDGPASTIIVAVAREREVALAWVGDSRAYSVMPGVPETLLTRDDSWCMDQVDAGRMTYEEATGKAEAHTITQWLGLELAAMVVHVRRTNLPPGAALLLCSDGLWNYADRPRAMGKAYTQACRDADAVTTCRRLVAFANAAGGRDNVTVALLRA